MNGTTKASQGNYLLDRGELASARLTFQHFAMIQMQGWILHPDISASLGKVSNLKIADLATGNGVWANQVADLYPYAEIVASDISNEQFPSPLARSKNTIFETSDLFDPVPTKYHGYFDLIHLRLTVGFIYDKDKDVLMGNILSMLKPGGWLQWEETTDSPLWMLHPDGRVTREIPRAWQRVFTVAPLLPALKWAKTLPDVYNQYGLHDVVGYEPQPRPSVLLPQKELMVWIIQEIMQLMVKNGKTDAGELDLAMKEIAEDYEAGIMWAYGWLVAIGRK